MDVDVSHCDWKFHKRVGLLKTNKVFVLGILALFVIGTAMATNTSQVNLTNVTTEFGTFTDIFGGDAVFGDTMLGLGLLVLFGLALLMTGMNNVVAMIILTPLIYIISGPLVGFLPEFLQPLVLIILATLWGIIIIRMFGVR